MIPEKVQKILTQNNLKAKEFEQGSTPTAAAAAEKLGVRVGQIAKSILFICKDGSFYLVVCPGDLRVSSSKLKKITGVKVRMANAEETFQATGFYPGGVCPFGIDSIEILLDRHLQDHEIIYPAAGNDASGVPITFEKLMNITKGQICDCTQEDR